MKIGSIESMTSAIALMGAYTLCAPAAMAQEGAEATTGSEIVVTAQRREERSVDVPISVSTLNNEQLATANVNALSDTAKLTPGLRFDTQGPGMQPTIRGVGTAINTSGAGPNVAIYVDGFFLPNTYAADLQLMKVQNIQVLKGPQGTLFGRNTTGGAILVTSADPSLETSAEVKASYGRFNALTLQAYATAGLGEKIAFDVEGLYRRGDGYITNALTGNDKIGKFENWSVRAGLKAWLSDDVTVLRRYTHTQTDEPTPQLVNTFVDRSGDAGFLRQVSPAGRAIYGQSSSQGLPLSYFYAPAGTFATRPGQVVLDSKTQFHTNIDIVQATIKADIGFADLTSYSQYRHDKTPYFADLDATTLPFFGLFVGVTDKTWSQEFVLSSKPGSRLQWTAGFNCFQYEDTWDVNGSFGGSPYVDFTGSSTKTKSIAGFLDATYEATDNLFLTVGGRFSHDEVTDAYFFIDPVGGYTDVNGLHRTGAPGTKIGVPNLKGDKFTPRVVVRYKPSNSSSIYASYTRGYKAGILNVGGLSQVPVKPEKIQAFEVGYKYDARVLSVELAGFYYDYKNLQVSSYQSGQAQIRNAASSEIYGVEGQFRYRVSDAFSVNAGGVWTHARYKSFPNAPYYTWCDPAAAAGSALWCVPQALGGFGPGAIVQSSIDASGFKMQRSPEFSGNIGASYKIPLADGNLTLSGNLYYTSSFYFDPEQQFRQDGYALLSLRAQWVDPSDRFTVAVFGDNVTNKRYQTQVLFTTIGTGAVWNSPTTYGVSLGAKF